MKFALKYPAAQATYGLVWTGDGAPLQLTGSKAEASGVAAAGAGKTATLRLAYRSQGLDRWSPRQCASPRVAWNYKNLVTGFPIAMVHHHAAARHRPASHELLLPGGRILLLSPSTGSPGGSFVDSCKLCALAAAEGAAAQFLYLVLFSYACFYKGFTGLAVIRWSERFAPHGLDFSGPLRQHDHSSCARARRGS